LGSCTSSFVAGPAGGLVSQGGKYMVIGMYAVGIGCFALMYAFIAACDHM
jgi:hypothetical protein